MAKRLVETVECWSSSLWLAHITSVDRVGAIHGAVMSEINGSVIRANITQPVLGDTELESIPVGGRIALNSRALQSKLQNATGSFAAMNEIYL